MASSHPTEISNKHRLICAHRNYEHTTLQRRREQVKQKSVCAYASNRADFACRLEAASQGFVLFFSPRMIIVRSALCK